MALRPAILIAFLLALPVSAQQDEPLHTKIVSAVAEPATAKPGDVIQLRFTLGIDPDWHIYSALGTYAPAEWKFEGPVERAGDITEPKPKEHKETLANGTQLQYGYHEGEVRFTVPVRLTKEAVNGPFKIKGKITGQECDPRICFTLDLPFEIPITVEGGAEPPPDYHTKIVSVTSDPAEVKQGDTFMAVFKVSIDPGWHIYSAVKEYNRTEWVFDSDSGVTRTDDPVIEPAPKYQKHDFGEGSFLEYWYHEGEVTFRVPVRSTGSAAPKLKGRMKGQECDPNLCVNLDIPFGTSVAVSAGGTLPGNEAQPPTTDPQSEGFVGLIVLGIIGGAISLIMPCVYPLLPVTLTYFIKQGGESKAKSVAMTSAYAAGIILVFTGVGFLFSMLWGADGPRLFAANPWVNVGVGLLFLWFAFSLLGMYEINLPSWMTGSFASQQRTGVGGAFILGALFSVVTFTCTIPIAAGILAVAATSGIENKFTGLVAMLVYSATMALPFVVFGLFPSLIKGIPKSGGWLHTVKVTAGLAELALALMYFAVADQVTSTGVLTRPVMIAVWVATLGAMTFYLFGMFRMKDDGLPGPIGVGRVLMAILFGVMAVYMGSAINSRHLGAFDILLPVAPPEEIGNYPTALEEAKRLRKPIFLEFTGFS